MRLRLSDLKCQAVYEQPLIDGSNTQIKHQDFIYCLLTSLWILNADGQRQISNLPLNFFDCFHCWRIVDGSGFNSFVQNVSCNWSSSFGFWWLQSTCYFILLVFTTQFVASSRHKHKCWTRKRSWAECQPVLHGRMRQRARLHSSLWNSRSSWTLCSWNNASFIRGSSKWCLYRKFSRQ